MYEGNGGMNAELQNDTRYLFLWYKISFGNSATFHISQSLVLPFLFFVLNLFYLRERLNNDKSCP